MGGVDALMGEGVIADWLMLGSSFGGDCGGMAAVDLVADVGSASLVAVWLARHPFDCRLRWG